MTSNPSGITEMIRNKATLFLYTFGALFFTVPWFFTPGAEGSIPRLILGFPTWAFYAVIASVLYAALISFCLGRYWDLAAGEDEDPAEDQH